MNRLTLPPYAVVRADEAITGVLGAMTRLCPYILPSCDQAELRLFPVGPIADVSAGEVLRLLLAATVDYMHRVGTSPFSLACNVVEVTGRVEDVGAILHELEWSHYILKHLFAKRQLLFGKFSHRNLPLIFKDATQALFVIRGFDQARDARFQPGLLIAASRSHDLLSEFWEEETLMGSDLTTWIESAACAELLQHLHAELSQNADFASRAGCPD